MVFFYDFNLSELISKDIDLINEIVIITISLRKEVIYYSKKNLPQNGGDLQQVNTCLCNSNR